MPRPPLQESEDPSMPIPAEPTKDEEERHNVTHTPFRDWCRHCLAGRGRGDAHKRRTEHEHHN
eukprot:3890314-Amphidinium_carterae.1